MFIDSVVERLAERCPNQPKVFIMDNVSFHRSRRVREAIANAGHTVKLLPAYSPFLNPVENAFSSLKADIRRPGGNMPPIDEQITSAISHLTQDKAQGWYREVERNFQIALTGNPITES